MAVNRPELRHGGISIVAIFRAALSALRLNVLRSLLTILGIIIGVAAVIVMVSIGSGANDRVERLIADLGTNVLTMRPGSSFRGGRHGGAGTSRPFTDRDIEALRREIDTVVAISGRVNGQAAIIRGNVNWTSTILGVQPDYLEVDGTAVVEGRMLANWEVDSSAKVAIVGQTVVDELFNGGAAIGERIRIEKVPFTVIGILEELGQSSFGQDRDDVILVPMTTARTRIFGSELAVRNAVPRISVKLADGVDMAAEQTRIETLMRQRRGIQPGAEDDFRIFNRSEFMRARSEAQATLSTLLAATAIISLVVGGIGIMNIMLVSVTERTREIGLRLAVGARGSDIRNQFLIEAFTLCLAGGIIGITLGVAVTIGVAAFADWPVLIGIEVILVALGASAAVGLFFGSIRPEWQR